MSDPQFPKHLVDAGQLYCDIMTEIKGRIDTLQQAGRIGFQPHAVPPPVMGDFFRIEFRMICELIAVACLVAHGDVAGARTRRLITEWRAGAILDQLGKLHPDFYPVPEEIWRVEGGKIRGARIRVDGFMTKDELLDLYDRECGDNLHRGSVFEIRAQMEKGGAPWPDLKKFKDALDKLVNLLRTHTIDLIDPKFKFWVEMESVEDKKVLVRVVDVSTLGGTRSELLAKYGRPVDESARRPEEPPMDSPKSP